MTFQMIFQVTFNVTFQIIVKETFVMTFQVTFKMTTIRSGRSGIFGMGLSISLKNCMRMKKFDCWLEWGGGGGMPPQSTNDFNDISTFQVKLLQVIFVMTFQVTF